MKLFLATLPKSTARFNNVFKINGKSKREAGNKLGVFCLHTAFFNIHIIRFPGPRRSGEARTSGDSGSDQAEVKVRRTVRCHRWRACKVGFFSRKIWIEEKFGKKLKNLDWRKVLIFSGLPRSTRCLPSRRRGSGWLLRENLPKWKINSKLCIYFVFMQIKVSTIRTKSFSLGFLLKLLPAPQHNLRLESQRSLDLEVCYFMFLVWR